MIIPTVQKNSSKIIETTTCFHCGDPCLEQSVSLEDKSFCCQGCKTVYQILSDYDLGAYYSIEKVPGTSQKGLLNDGFEYLDDPDIRQQLISFSEGKTIKVTFFFPQIHCSSCIWLLENLYKIRAGVLSAQINFLKKQGTFLINEEQLTLRQLVELLSTIGYSPEIKLEKSTSSNKAIDHSLYYQLGIAGFCFGNIMLLSFPEYLGLEGNTFASWFGYINLLLSLPVLLYCSKDYLLSAWWGIKQGQLNMDVPIALGITTLFVRSAFEILSQTGAGYLDSLAGLVFFLLIGKWFQQTTYHTIQFERDYKSYFPIAVTVKKNGSWRSIPLAKVEPNDLLLIRHEELIPTDGILTKGQGKIDYSFVTGESKVVPKVAGQQLFAGGKQLESAIELTVNKKVEQSYLTQLWNESAFRETNANQSTRFADQTGKYFTIIILIIAFFTLTYWLIHDPSMAFNAFTAVLIIACPCAIALSIPFTYGNVLRVLSNRGFYLKHINVIEKIQSISHIVFDKTGTLTSTNDLSVQYHGTELSKEEKKWVHSLTQQSNHPLSKKISEALDKYTTIQPGRYQEVIGQGIEGTVEGQEIRIGSAKYLQVAAQASDSTRSYVKINEQVKGYFEFKNPLRSGLKANFQLLNKTYQLRLLSGDTDHSKGRFLPFFNSPNDLKFRQSPFDKLNYIKELQTKSQAAVMMIGDGLNDSGALKQSNVGIVLTENTNNFTPASDAILAAEQFPNLARLLRFMGQSKKVIWVTYAIAFVYNIIGLSFAVQGLLAPVIAAILMPLSSVTVVTIGVGLTSLLGQWVFQEEKQSNPN